MKKILPLILFIVLSISSRVFATHAIGADLTYRSVNDSTYELTFTFYRDCYGIDAPFTIPITIENTCGYPIQQISLPIVLPVIRLEPSCPNIISVCEGGNLPGIEETVYRGNVVLSASCSAWLFSGIVNSRNASITTIVNPDSYGLYVEAVLDNSVIPNNSSPVFNHEPLFFSSINQPFLLRPDISDPDGDSIVCSMIAPKIGPNSTISYQPGYSILQPLNSNPPLKFDDRSGNIFFTPVTHDVAIFAILVQEYRNGILIGEVERDFQHYVVSGNHTPFASGNNVNGTNSISFCAGQQMCFSFSTSDFDQTDSTKIILLSGIPTSSFLAIPGINEQGIFCWTPTASDISTIPYKISVLVKDNHCQFRAEQIFDYYITVQAPDSTCLNLSSNNLVDLKNEINIYPQPATDLINIQFPENLIGKNYQLQISNVLGKQVQKSSLLTMENPVTLDLSLSNGLYFVSVLNNSGENIAREKFIVQR